MKHYTLGAFVVLLLMLVPSVAAASSKVCVPSKASTAIKTPSAAGECPTGDSAQWTVSEEQHEALEHVGYEKEGLNKKPTINIAGGVNVRIFGFPNSETGNLLVGINAPGTYNTGSNNFVVGYRNNSYGEGNAVFGKENGVQNKWNVVGGIENHTGYEEETEGNAVFGMDNWSYGAGDLLAGEVNEDRIGSTSGKYAKASVIFGCGNQLESGVFAASILGGCLNKITASRASILGGHEVTATTEYEEKY
jgi:hypothetical protein